MNAFMVCENEILLKNKFSVKGIDKDNNYQELRNGSQNLRSKAQSLRNKSKSLRNKSQELKNELQELRSKAKAIRNASQILRSTTQTSQNESQVLRNKSQNLRSETQAIRNDSFLARNEAQNLISEAQAIRIRSEVLRLESKALRNALFNDANFTPFSIKRNITFNDLEDALDTTSLFEDIETDNSSDLDGLDMSLFEDIKTDNELFEHDEELADMVIEEKEDNERKMHFDKTNELIDQVNLLVKTRNDFSKNVNEICMLMNKLQR